MLYIGRGWLVPVTKLNIGRRRRRDHPNLLYFWQKARETLTSVQKAPLGQILRNFWLRVSTPFHPFGSHGTCTTTLVRKKRGENPGMRRTYFQTGPLLGTWLPVRVGHVTDVTSGGPLGRILHNSSGHVTGHVTRHFRSCDFLSRDFRLLYLAPPPQIWLELSPYTTLLEELSMVIAPILTILFNKSVTTGIVPSDWRTAHVSSVYKKGQKYNPENYRLISLTCICCKLLEHLIVKHIMSHAEHP
jgi:hypothetical protein